MEKTLVRFRHCGTDFYRFSTSDSTETADGVENRCPICRQLLRFGLCDAPVTVPSPFTDGHRVPCAFLLGSVYGATHLGEWSDTEIHVGISNSRGVVYNYTHLGVLRDTEGWEQCVCVQLVPPWRPRLWESWDDELEQFSTRPDWTPERFEEQRSCGRWCFSFALSFVNHSLSLEGRAALTPDQFTASLLLPRIKSVSLYLRVYHAVSECGVFRHQQNHTHSHTHRDTHSQMHAKHFAD